MIFWIWPYFVFWDFERRILLTHPVIPSHTLIHTLSLSHTHTHTRTHDSHRHTHTHPPLSPPTSRQCTWVQLLHTYTNVFMDTFHQTFMHKDKKALMHTHTDTIYRTIPSPATNQTASNSVFGRNVAANSRHLDVYHLVQHHNHLGNGTHTHPNAQCENHRETHSRIDLPQWYWLAYPQLRSEDTSCVEPFASWSASSPAPKMKIMTLWASSPREFLLAPKGQEVHRETVTSDEGRSEPFVLTSALALLNVCACGRVCDLLWINILWAYVSCGWWVSV